MALNVVALGGNALMKRGEDLSFDVLKKNVSQIAEEIASQLRKGQRLVITHGNGPQVGLLALSQPKWPLDCLVAQSQGMIGFLLENELRKRGIDKVVCCLTLVAVDDAREKTKPVGPFYDTKPRDFESALDEKVKKYRKVVCSPKPVSVLNIASIKTLVDNGFVCICCGGGGVAVSKEGETVEAVIDKDLVSSLLATQLDADRLLILTDVPYVFENFGKANERKIQEFPLHGENLSKYPAGSMRPKIEAAIQFSRSGKTSVIGNNLSAMLRDEGTLFQMKSKL